MKTRGLFFRRFDLHIHTPASECFLDKKITPEQIVSKSVQKGLSAIAITDHNTGEWIDRVKKVRRLFLGLKIVALKVGFYGTFGRELSERSGFKLPVFFLKGYCQTVKPVL